MTLIVQESAEEEDLLTISFSIQSTVKFEPAKRPLSPVNTVGNGL